MTTINDNAPITVRNLVDHKVVYNIPEINRRVVFEPFQEKKIQAGELRALNYSTGGEILIHNYLCVKDKDLREEFNIPADMVEYDWTIKDIHRVLEDLDSPIEALEDALDFGPDGIKELIVDCAVKWKIPDANRRKVISRMTGVNVDKMIEFAELTEQVADVPVQRTRRLSEQEAPRTGRRIQN
jgi:hypothetical protein